jgi:alpha-mannosidase
MPQFADKMGAMPYEDLIILIPSHSLEDFPSELAEAEAASLLNCFAVAWHPALLASARILPRWHRADDPPDSTQKRLILLPANCDSWIPAGWAERIASEGCVVVRGSADRSEMIAAALAPLDAPICDPELVADFMALGFCYLQIELLTRKMRHFSNLDEVHLQREAVAAAEAALAGDAETARTRLKFCFEVLAESRERFYPVDCYLLDVCLLIPRLADEHFKKMLLTLKPTSVLVSARDLSEIADQKPEFHAALKEAWARGTADLVCGDLRELPLPLMPLNSVVWQLREAQDLVERELGKRPAVWGRRRYGLFPQLPQLLKKSGFEGALHTVLDDGIYPDAEHSKLRWEGIDGTSIDALTRIPLAADAATSFLRYADRMSESMDNDHVAAVIFARWPEVNSPYLEDLRRMARYAPVLGRFVTLSDFFANTDQPTRHARYKPGEYLTPYLFQAVAREESDPISRFFSRLVRRTKFDTGSWLCGMRELLSGRAPDAASVASLEWMLETPGDTPAEDACHEVDSNLERFVEAAGGDLAELVLAGAGDQRGFFVFNTLGFRRVVTVEVDRQGPRPQPAGEQAFVQWDDMRAYVTVDVPGAGFVWIPSADEPRSIAPATAEPALAEPNLLRNEFFEVHLNETTGGIAKIKGYGRSPNRLSQQLNYRFSRERMIAEDRDNQLEETRTFYGEMRCQSSAVTCEGPALGEIITTGEIVDQTNGQRLAGFEQTVRVWRGRPVVEVDVELVVDRMPDAEPWHNYFAARFAWHDETASITRAVMLGAHEFAEERMESPDYIELATLDQRTTIVSPGLPFHRKTGPRMIDTILVVSKECRRRFRFVIAVDQNYPLQAALDAQTPAVIVPTRTGPPRSGSAGWFFHLSARNVQMLGLLPLLAEPARPAEDWQPAEPVAAPAGCGCGVRLVESEGRPVQLRLRCFRTPRSARQRDFNGHTLHALSIDGDAVLVDLSAYEIADVEIRFD